MPAAGDGGVEQLPPLAGPGVVTRGADVAKQNPTVDTEYHCRLQKLVGRYLLCLYYT